MTDNKRNNANGSIGFCGLLTLLLIGLKLTHNIDFSWYLVFAPLWIPIMFVSVVLMVLFCILLIAFLLGRMEDYQEKKK